MGVWDSSINIFKEDALVKGIIFSPLIFFNLIFLEHFYVHGKIEVKVQRFAIYPSSHICPASPLSTFLHQRGTFDTTEELTRIHQYLLNPQFTLGFTLSGVPSMGLEKCVMTGVIQTTDHFYCPEKILCALLIHPWQPLIF